MAIKERPKGKIKDFITLTSSEISKLSDKALKGIVSKLFDAANKRIKRINREGLEYSVPAVRARLGKGGAKEFRIAEIGDRDDLEIAYSEVREFLATKTSKVKEARSYAKKYGKMYDEVLDEDDYDKRYKTKKVIKKSGKKKLRDFWETYSKWRELDKKHNPDKYAGTTNLNYVEEFEEEIYAEGKTSIAEMEEIARKGYEDDESSKSNSVSSSTAKRGRKRTAKQNKQQKTGIKTGYKKVKSEFGITTKYEKIKKLY